MVIPKEIRRTQRIRQGDALEIFTDTNGEVVFKKYSPLLGLGQLSAVYAEVLAKDLGVPVMVCGPGRACGRHRPAPHRAERPRHQRCAAQTAGDARGLYGPGGRRPPPARAGARRPSGALRRAHRRPRAMSKAACCCWARRPTPPPGEPTVHALCIAAAFLAKWMGGVRGTGELEIRNEELEIRNCRRPFAGPPVLLCGRIVSKLLNFQRSLQKPLTVDEGGV